MDWESKLIAKPCLNRSKYAQALVWIQGEGNQCSTKKRDAIKIRVSSFKIETKNYQILFFILLLLCTNMHQTCKRAHQYSTLLPNPFEITPVKELQLDNFNMHTRNEKQLTCSNSTADARAACNWIWQSTRSRMVFDSSASHSTSPSWSRAAGRNKTYWANLLFLREHFPPVIEDPLIKLKFEPSTSVRLQVYWMRSHIK